MRRYLIWVAVFVLTLAGCQKVDDRFRDYSAFNPSGDFVLTDQDGGVFHLKDQKGKAILLFFGYISCPDVCPTTFSKLSRVYALLGENGSDVLSVFVTIDPERDTPAKLKEYLSYFKVPAVGLSGTREEVDRVVDAYKASYQKVEVDSAAGYLMDHSDYMYLIDQDGKMRYLFHYEDRAEHIADVIQKL